MSRSRLIVIIIIVIFLAVALLTIVYYSIRNKIAADTLKNNRIDQIEKVLDLDNNGSNELLTVTLYRQDNKVVAVAEASGPDLIKSQININGFENNISFCQNPIIDVNTKNRLICLFGNVGVHSQNIVLLKLSENKIKTVNFAKDDQVASNITSDVPLFGFEDANQDGTTDFYLEDRNYDKDPLLDSLRSYYYFINDQFVFNHVVNINHKDQGDQSGKISKLIRKVNKND